MELTEQFWLPSITARRLTDDDHTSEADTRHRRPQREFRRSEASSDRCIETDVARLNRVAHICSKYLGVGIEIQASNHLCQEVGALRPSIKQGQLQIWSIGGDHQPGNTASGTQINDCTSDTIECGDECPRMLNDLRDRPIPQKAEALGSSQRLV